MLNLTLNCDNKDYVMLWIDLKTTSNPNFNPNLYIDSMACLTLISLFKEVIIITVQWK